MARLYSIFLRLQVQIQIYPHRYSVCYKNNQASIAFGETTRSLEANLFVHLAKAFLRGSRVAVVLEMNP